MKATYITVLISFAFLAGPDRGYSQDLDGREKRSQLLDQRPKVNKLLQDIRGVWKEYLTTAPSVSKQDAVDTLFFGASYNEFASKKERLSSVLKIKKGDKSIDKITAEGEVIMIKSWVLRYLEEATVKISMINFDKNLTNIRITDSKVITVSKHELVLEEINTGINHYYRK